MSSCSTLRAKAREMLGGNLFAAPWLYPLLVCLIISAINGLASAIIVGSLIVVGPLNVGSALYFLNVARKKENASSDIGAMLKPVSNDAGGTIILGLLTTLFTVLWTMLFIIPGIVKSFSYAMAPYIKADHPEYTATQALDESRRIMKGNKWRLFCLSLSFIGWIIVGALACGIGTLWVAPYMSAAQAAFYEEIKDTPAQA